MPDGRRPSWRLVSLALVVGLPIIGGVAFLAYVGTTGPDTKVYAGNEIPRRFLTTIRELGMLEAEEKIQFFYSSAILDIRGQFCFVSDRKVAVYNSDAERPATAVGFGEIEKAELESSSSWLVDSGITLALKNGDVVAFEVSSELGRDRQFHSAIEEGIERSREVGK